MNIDTNITFRDALFLAVHLVDKENINKMYNKTPDDKDRDVETTNYQLAFELFDIAIEIYKESIRRSTAK
ncbi:hypothetical protein B0187_00750 [Haemophilus paracuniculus]|uniref:Uncharacterized protein n=1 Tax=Haemophilus paracuniculus TaxID=734 RepID=A0A1T0AVE2_9PAST|nr:hypothetical protein [Haemophilus paracuniculus]OOS00854.1 hypothetical protein B0187_00750 [Haemophilus paracuniculus]